MNYRTVSSKVILGKVYRDFKPAHAGWHNDAIEWIGEAIDIMKIPSGMVLKSKEVEVIDYRVSIPCDLYKLEGIEYNQKRLPRTGGINAADRCSCLQNLTCHTDESYHLNPGYIFTTFQEGCITLHYIGIDIDCDGFPKVIDEAKVHEAITWYILRQLCLRGFKHQVVDFKMADVMWEKSYPRAQNACILTDIDDMELFKKSWLGLVKSTNMTNEFFNTVVDDIININAPVAPGTLVENSLTVKIGTSQ